ncbi:hypothetical protein AQI88_30500 [Streptomyces cellostaticus]|uniref:Uncharacterized protein n=1 Tax=Streptomyces cellostaticus TaxID=67285 RepID=A0A101NG82_9ACTN|nr:hypothetical protein AQI88_30500 [Streptomyces cellostaticus]
MSVQGVDLTAVLRVVLRTVVCGSRVASPPARQGRPREKLRSETLPLTVEALIRRPLRFAAVEGAVTKPAE